MRKDVPPDRSLQLLELTLDRDADRAANSSWWQCIEERTSKCRPQVTFLHVFQASSVSMRDSVDIAIQRWRNFTCDDRQHAADVAGSRVVTIQQVTCKFSLHAACAAVTEL